MNFSNLTIISLTGDENYTQGSMYAIERSCLELQGAKGLLISPTRPANLPAHIKHIPCKKFSYMEYNLYVLYALKEVIDTEFCLIVQPDGWVVNGKNWRDEFFNYDFIGSVVPSFVIRDERGITLENSQCWIKKINGQHFDYSPPNHQQTLNGGFSLRSKRLLNIATELKLPVFIPPPDTVFKDGKLETQWKFPTYNEDTFLTGLNREKLTQHGIKFADRRTATQFSIETPYILGVLQAELTQCLGLHYRYLHLTGVNEVSFKPIIAQLEKDWQNHPNVIAIIQWLNQLGYRVNMDLN
ncbi:DUF5672 family protein [Lonepinella sp. BR2474]|uniref:DUF5672 family protein n=1 Tax=Lonepinella sp. BR2474 TaxID=3434548 RepID=UPI003F6DDC17